MAGQTVAARIGSERSARVFSAMLLLMLIWCRPLAAWDMQPVAELPAAITAQLPVPGIDGPSRADRRYFELNPRADWEPGRGGRLLVLARDRGQRVLLYAANGTLQVEIPAGALPAEAGIGVRGALLRLPAPVDQHERRYLVIESILGVQPRPLLETLAQFYDRELGVWIFEISLTAALIMLITLSLAFAAILREPGYLAYVAFLVLMLGAIWARHPMAYRYAADIGAEPERIAALGVLLSTMAAYAAVTLLRAASGVAMRYPRASRAMLWVAAAGILLGVIDVLAIVSWLPLAQLAFNAINLSFGLNALLSAWLLTGTAAAGGRSARWFLLGWMPMVLVGGWFSVGSLIGLPQTADPHRWVMLACALQGIGWAVALGDRALSMRRERDRAWALAELDSLTGLPNRRMLDRELGEARAGYLLLCDLDQFKSVNDRYGHASGDRCLMHFAQCLRESLAGLAVFGRYGGEEFLAIVPGASAEDAFALAERLRERTSSTPVQFDSGRHRLTVSIGVAAVGASESSSALAQADRALYRAKALGRNRVEMAAPA